jgi:histidinol-phosphate aminotransferase
VVGVGSLLAGDFHPIIASKLASCTLPKYGLAMSSSDSKFNIQTLALPHVVRLHAYTPGLQPGEPGWIKLNTNENPYPPSPRVAEALRREIGDDGASLRLYPNAKSDPLREALGRLHRLAADHVFIGNGADDVLNLLVRCFCEPAAAAGFTLPSYSLYPVLVGIQDGQAIAVEFDRSMQLPLETIAGSTAGVFFLTSPNAPTGVGFRTADIETLLLRYRGLLVVDETYAVFAGENAVDLVERHPNLCVVRTFSKSHCLAGMRIGYALAQPGVIGLLDRVKDSYNVSRLSQAAALAALADPDYYAGLVRKIRATRDRARQTWTDRFGWFTYPSQTNFLFTEPRDRTGRTGPDIARGLYDFLCARKILVRHFGSHALTSSFLRISVGTDEEMIVLQENLQAWLKSA